MKLLSLIASADAYINVCYYTSWAQYRNDPYKFTPENIDANLCTHINYGFAFVNDWGTNVRTYEWNDEAMYKRVMAKRRENPSLKVYLSVGGWTHGTGPFKIAAASDSSRATFARNSLQFIQTHDFDGIDIDWEYPGYKGRNPRTVCERKFAQKLRRKLYFVK